MKTWTENRLVMVLALTLAAVSARAGTCPESSAANGDASAVRCPCFVVGERAGAVLRVPPDAYPIEILRVGIAWASHFGGAPQSLEGALLVYGAGLPDPGTPLFRLEGPVLSDGFINEFDLEPLPGEIRIDSGDFTVALEFANMNAGDPFASTVLHDGNGCTQGRNVVFAIPGGWRDACSLGVTGDWSFSVVYRSLNCTSDPAYIRGDANADGTYDISDPIYQLNALFGGGPGVPCERAADTNNDGTIDISDPLYSLNRLFGSGLVPAAPHPACGTDAGNSGGLECADFPGC